MKKTVYVITTLAALVVCGCSEVDEVPLRPCDNNSITLGLDQVRTTLGESIEGVRSLYWSSGDRIMANELISSEAKIEGDKAKAATFDFESKINYPCNLLYPAAFYQSENVITLPELQEASVGGSMATNTLPMATCIEQESEIQQLHHLAALLHLQLRAKSDGYNNNLLKVEFRGNNAEQVSGDFTIDYTTATLTPSSEKETAKVVGVLVSGELSQEEVTDIFIVVPAQEYKNGFTIRIINEMGHYMDKEKPSGETIVKGEILKQPEFSFVPTGTLVGVEIPSGI